MSFCYGVLKFQDIITNNYTCTPNVISKSILNNLLRYEVPLFKHIKTDGHTTRRSRATL